MRDPSGGYGGMNYTPPYSGNQMQDQFGGGGYNMGCPTSPCGGASYGGGNMGGSPYGMGPGTGQYGANMNGNQYGGNTNGNQYRGSMNGNQNGGSMNSNQQRGSMNSNQNRGDMTAANLSCPMSPCARGNEDDDRRNSGDSRNGNGGQQVPCLECGSLPNPPCLGAGMDVSSCGPKNTTPCQECGGLTNPPCAGNGQGNGGGGGGVSLTPCQECGGLPNAPCGATTCGGTTPCCECAGNPDAPCLNMGPCEYCPGPPVAVVSEEVEKETFVLKIGKKRMGTEKKPKMEVELVTPKAAPLKPIPKHETRETQYDTNDIPGKKNGKGKGKKKKK